MSKIQKYREEKRCQAIANACKCMLNRYGWDFRREDPALDQCIKNNDYSEAFYHFQNTLIRHENSGARKLTSKERVKIMRYLCSAVSRMVRTCPA